MKMILLLLLLTAYSFNCYSQKEVKLEQLKDHIGDSIKIQGKISEVRIYGDRMHETLFVLLIMGLESSDHLYVRINPAYAKLANLPGFELEQKKLMVYGKIDTLRKFFQIVVNDPHQLQILK